MMMVMTRMVNAKKMEGGEMQRNVEKCREMKRNEEKCREIQRNS